ncbi:MULTISPECIES: hypothetical protein [Gordonibacter]|uniref:DUF4376 domain-containing protein n=1 Tax=Gordonibacter faecis TaxID=3047475 RepID=A0ABT7DK13_9ACTN|nr:hypothetical protein [Gordonibacter sp. KGMB12511]MDJ1649870.1 hypothetical protein [Gordonibacter sp. KGMB12511]
MIIKAYYSGGRIDVFDTDHLVDGVPQPGNLLTNYTLDLSDVADDSLWLRSYYHEAVDAYRDETGPTGLPVARRRDGWSFLIADADDLERLNRLTMDGETVLARVAGELVDAAALSWAWECAEELAAKAAVAYRFLLGSTGAQEAVVLDAMGVPAECFEAMMAGQLSEASSGPRF